MLFFLLPYRVKNPVKHFPFATVAIIALNVVVFLSASDGISMPEGTIEDWAFKLGTTPFYNLITAMFLHADITHIFGNMLFLWVFGPAVEDRLRPPLYLLLYFLAGTAGTFLQVPLDLATAGHPLFGLGASGCILGVLGAYWYLFSWSPAPTGHPREWATSPTSAAPRPASCSAWPCTSSATPRRSRRPRPFRPT